MKKAIVYTQEYQDKVIGQVDMVMDASDMDNWTHHILNFAVKVEVPEELEELPTTLMEGVLVAHQSQSWTKDGETVYEQPEDLEGWTYQAAIPQHWEIQTNAAYIEYDKSRRISEKFAILNNEVGVEMHQVYQTSNPDSAVANYLTWMSMKNNPAKYVGSGLVARFDVVGLSVGDALDTETKILNYATALIDAADDYAIWREQKILTFVADRLAIQAE